MDLGACEDGAPLLEALREPSRPRAPAVSLPLPLSALHPSTVSDSPDPLFGGRVPCRWYRRGQVQYCGLSVWYLPVGTAVR
eukprot:2941929-Rhodomonas_salina.1